MKSFLFRSLLLACVVFFVCTQVFAGENQYDQRINNYKTRWERLIPKYGKVQYAGSMGFLSVGTGWDYGKKKQWETDIMLGFIPKYSTDKFKITLTVKENFMPWDIRLGSQGFSFEPVAIGFYLNTVFGENFWTFDPSRYPNGYYSTSTKIRFNVYLGQRISFVIPHDKRHRAQSLTFFYEVSSNDLYIRSAADNSYLKPKDYLHLSLGLKIQWL